MAQKLAHRKPDPDPGGQRWSMPTWIPGSYLIREFAKHVVRISARSSASAAPVEKVAAA